MKRVLSLLVTFLFFLLLPQAQCLLQGNEYIRPDGSLCANPIFTAVPFLQIVPDARVGGMGDAGIAVSPDANAMLFNDAKLGFVENNWGASGSYVTWLDKNFERVFLAYLTGYYRLNERSVLAIGGRFFSPSDVTLINQSGQSIRSSTLNEFELKAALSHRFSNNWSVGIGVKYIESELPVLNVDLGNASSSLATDLSIVYQKKLSFDDVFRAGLSLNNLGSKMSYNSSIIEDFLPANLGLGFAYELQISKKNRITLVGDINKLLVPTPCRDNCDKNNNGIDDYKEQSVLSSIFSSFSDAPLGAKEEFRELIYSTGVEYWYNNWLAIRAGYFYEHPTKGNQRYWTTGVGVNIKDFNANVSYQRPIRNDSGVEMLRFTLLYEFARDNSSYEFY